MFYVSFGVAMKPVDFLDIDSKSARSIFPKSVFIYSDNVIKNKYEDAGKVLKQIITDSLLVKSMFHEDGENTLPIGKAIENAKLTFIKYIKDKHLFEPNFLEEQYLLANILNVFYFYSSYTDINEISDNEFSKIKKSDLYSFKLLKKINRPITKQISNNFIISNNQKQAKSSLKKMAVKKSKLRQTKITDFFKPKKVN